METNLALPTLLNLQAETATIPFWVMEEASYLEANLGEPVQASSITQNGILAILACRLSKVGSKAKFVSISNFN